MNTATVTYRKRKLNGRMNKSVQDPTCAQNFNRYAYCMNNPLRYVDPSGWQMVGGSTPKHYDWRDKEVPYEPRDYREGSSYMINLRLSGGGGYGGGGVAGTYGYIAAHDPHYINNNFYIDPSPIMRAPTVSEAVRAWWNDPCFETRQALIDAGISELNIGVVEEEGLLYGGARIGFGGKEYYLSLPTLAVGGNDFYVGVIAPYIDNVSSAGSELSGLTNANLAVQSFALGNGIKTELIDWAVRTNYKSARSWGEFRNLRATQQKFRYVNTLGKTGYRYFLTLTMRHPIRRRLFLGHQVAA